MPGHRGTSFTPEISEHICTNRKLLSKFKKQKHKVQELRIGRNLLLSLAACAGIIAGITSYKAISANKSTEPVEQTTASAKNTDKTKTPFIPLGVAGVLGAGGVGLNKRKKVEEEKSFKLGAEYRIDKATLEYEIDQYHKTKSNLPDVISWDGIFSYSAVMSNILGFKDAKLIARLGDTTMSDDDVVKDSAEVYRTDAGDYIEAGYKYGRDKYMDHPHLYRYVKVINPTDETKPFEVGHVYMDGKEYIVEKFNTSDGVIQNYKGSERLYGKINPDIITDSDTIEKLQELLKTYNA